MQSNIRRANPYLAAAIVALFASPPQGAWSQSAPETALPQVEVVGTSPLPGIGIAKNKLPYEVQSVNAETLQRSQTMNLTEYMARNLSGVNVNEVQGSPFQADVTYRGFRASAILGSAQGLSVYLDGVRVNEPFGDIVNWDMLPESAFASVTLVPGSNPIYGLNTLGGALAFTTKSGLTAPGTELKLSAGSFGRKRVDIAHGRKSEDGWHQFISATVFDEKGWRDDSPGSLGNVFAKIGRVQGNTNWDISLLAGRSNLRGNGLLPSTNYGVEAENFNAPTGHMYERNRRSVYTHPDLTRNELNMLTFNLQHMLDSSTELSSTSYVRQSSRRSVNGDAESATEAELNYSATSQVSYGSAVNLTKVIEQHHLTAGASFDASQMRYGASQREDCSLDASRGVPLNCAEDKEPTAKVTGKSYAIGLYAADTYTLAPSTYLTTAARFNHARVGNTLTSYERESEATESFAYNSLNPSIGLSHKLNPTITAFGNVGQSNRVPTVLELGCADKLNPCQLPTGLQADPYLKQVIARTIEAGMRWTLSKETGASVAVYRTQNKDDILFRAISDRPGFGYFDNFSRTLYQGLDLSGHTTIGQIAMRATYNFLHATYDATGALFGGEREIAIAPGTRIAGLPRHTVKLHADWRATPKMVIGGTLMATSSLVTQGNEDGLIGEEGETQKVDARVRGYTLLHLHGNYEAQKGLDYFFRINNVLNQRFETYGMMAQSVFAANGTPGGADPTMNRFVAPGAPRSFMVGVRYRF